MEEKQTFILGDSQQAEIEQKDISGNGSVKVRTFPGVTTHDMYDYLKPLLRRTQTTLSYILEPIIRWIKNFEIFWMEHYLQTCNVILSNIIYRSDNKKASLTVKIVNDHLDAWSIDIADSRNIGGSCLANRGLHLNSTGYDMLVINFIKKMKTSWCLDSLNVIAQTTVRKFLIK